MIEIKNLRKTYGKKVALKSFSYTFEDGIYGMLGANGAGKSTLMNLLTDNVKRDSGEILYDGKEILKMGGSYLEKVGYMPQQQGFYESFSARMFLVYMAELKGLRKKEAKKQIENLLEIVHLSHVADKKIGGFSGGMKQRVLLAQALLGNPKLLILDEPTAGLDPKERVNLRNYIHQLSQNKIILLATHVVSDVESIADRILIMKAGELVADDTPEHLVHAVDGNNLEDVYMNYFGDKGFRHTGLHQSFLVIRAPALHCHKNRSHGFARFAQSIFHMRRNFRVNGSGDETV